MKPRYTFEKMQGGGYQVRLKGEFVMNTWWNHSDKVDAYLKMNGFDTREAFLEFCYKENAKEE